MKEVFFFISLKCEYIVTLALRYITIPTHTFSHSLSPLRPVPFLWTPWGNPAYHRNLHQTNPASTSAHRDKCSSEENTNSDYTWLQKSKRDRNEGAFLISIRLPDTKTLLEVYSFNLAQGLALETWHFCMGAFANEWWSSADKMQQQTSWIPLSRAPNKYFHGFLLFGTGT